MGNENKLDANKIFTQICECLKDPNDAREYYILAYSLECIERYNDALEAINRSLQYDNKYIHALKSNGGGSPRCKQTGHARRRRMDTEPHRSEPIPKLNTYALYPRCKHRGIALK